MILSLNFVLMEYVKPNLVLICILEIFNNTLWSNAGLLAKKLISVEIPPDTFHLYLTKELYVVY